MDGREAARTDEYIPRPHATQVVADIAAETVENVPLRHDWQSDSNALPSESRYLPALQLEQYDLPFDGLNLPARQGLQSEELWLPFEAENVPAMHSWHSDEPSTIEYLPAAHKLQEVSDLLPVRAAYLPSTQF